MAIGYWPLDFPSRFFNFQNATGPNILQYLGNATRPADFDLIDGGILPQAKVHTEMTAGSVADSSGHVVPLFANANAGTNSIPIALAADKSKDDPVVLGWADVMPQLCLVLKG